MDRPVSHGLREKQPAGTRSNPTRWHPLEPAGQWLGSAHVWRPLCRRPIPRAAREVRPVEVDAVPFGHRPAAERDHFEYLVREHNVGTVRVDDVTTGFADVEGVFLLAVHGLKHRERVRRRLSVRAGVAKTPLG